MTVNRLLAVVTLALGGGSTAFAYEIVESRYRIEIAPGKFQDQLVLKCDNGRKIVVPWDARLYEACGEDLVDQTPKSEDPQEVAQQRQKEVITSRVREQHGAITAKNAGLESGPNGTAQLPGPVREIYKRYEICRKQTKNSPRCAAERDQAMAALGPGDGKDGEQPAVSTAVRPALPEGKALDDPSVTTTKPAPSKKKAAAKGKPPAEPAAPQTQPTEAAGDADQTKPTPVATPEPQPTAAPANEQKIAEDYTWCLRAKPKFECDQLRAKALGMTKPKAAKPAPKLKSMNETAAMKAAYAAAR